VVDCPPLPVPVSVDAEAWERIVSNLVSNALKFTPRVEIRVGLSADDDCAALTVADTGVGIAPHDVETVFGRFRRVARQGARTSEGSGIGLALVRELAHLHGGSVAAESRPGAGTRMTVRIPLDGTGAPAAPAGPAGAVAAPFVAEAEGWLEDPPGPVVADLAGGDRVVVVEDQPDMSAYLRRLLGSEYEPPGWFRRGARRDHDAGLRRLRTALVLGEQRLVELRREESRHRPTPLREPAPRRAVGRGIER
jgi:anti-sigma regulatory factor (Ser/Thr protein kinase)